MLLFQGKEFINESKRERMTCKKIVWPVRTVGDDAGRRGGRRDGGQPEEARLGRRTSALKKTFYLKPLHRLDLIKIIQIFQEKGNI